MERSFGWLGFGIASRADGMAAKALIHNVGGLCFGND